MEVQVKEKGFSVSDQLKSPDLYPLSLFGKKGKGIFSVFRISI